MKFLTQLGFANVLPRAEGGTHAKADVCLPGLRGSRARFSTL